MPVPFVGDFIRNLQVEECLGNGQYGYAFLVREEDDPKNQKVLKMSVMRNSFQEKSWKREIRAMQSVQSVDDRGYFLKFDSNFQWADETDTFGCIVMSKGGVSLLDALRNKPSRRFCPPNVLKIGWSLAQALRLLHSKGYYHRDLHENNILIRNPIAPGAPVTIIDFGLSLRFKTRRGRRIFQMGHDINLKGTMHCSLNVEEGRAYKEIDDYESMFYSMLTISNVNPFHGTRQQMYGQKKSFHLNPHFFIPSTPWLLKIFETIQAQTHALVFDADKILHAIEQSFPFDPEEKITYRIEEDNIIIF